MFKSIQRGRGLDILGKGRETPIPSSSIFHGQFSAVKGIAVQKCLMGHMSHLPTLQVLSFSLCPCCSVPGEPQDLALDENVVLD